MTADENADELRRLAYATYEAINQKDIDRLDQLFAPDVIRHAMGEKGLAAARRAVEETFAGAPGLYFLVHDVIVENDRAALRVEVQDRSKPQDGPNLVIIEIFRFENGKIAEIWGAGSVPRPMQP